MLDDNTVFNLFLLGCSFVFTVAGITIYRRLAIKFDIVAKKNHRTLHSDEVPKGSGIVLSIVYIILVYIVWLQDLISNDLMVVICAGGLCATLFGFIDDVINVSAIIKLLVQVFLTTFIVLWLGQAPILLSATQSPVDTGFIGIILAIGILVWLINLYNFMDGVDGMAASGTIFISTVIAMILFFIEGNSPIALLFALFAVTCLGFLLFNWPPASIFMGDAGSVFIGYVFGVFIIYTMMHGDISIWTWLIVFGYFGIDTTVTLLSRIVLVKKWYGAHRSHAYQNLARVWGSHRKILCSVIAYHLLWLFPLAVLSAIYNQYQEILCLFAISPVILWTLKYGPIFSSD